MIIPALILLVAANASVIAWLWFDDRHARRARRSEEALFEAFEAQFAGSAS